MQLPHLETQEDVKAESKSQKEEDEYNGRPQQSFHGYLQHNDENSTIFKSRNILEIKKLTHFSCQIGFHSVSVFIMHQY